MFVTLFGLNEVAVSLTNILYFVAFLALNAWFLARQFGWPTVGFATGLLIVLPGFTVLATYFNPDVPELFFVSCAFWMIVAGSQDADKRVVWILAGFVLGAASVTREPAFAALAFVAALFVFAPGVPRSRYLLAAGSWFIVVWRSGSI